MAKTHVHLNNVIRLSLLQGLSNQPTHTYTGSASVAGFINSTKERVFAYIYFVTLQVIVWRVIINIIIIIIHAHHGTTNTNGYESSSVCGTLDGSRSRTLCSGSKYIARIATMRLWLE